MTIDWLKPLGVEDSSGYNISEYGLDFDTSIGNPIGMLWAFLTELFYGLGQILTAFAGWFAKMLSQPSGLFGGMEDAFTSAVKPIFDIVPLPVVATLAAVVPVVLIGVTKTKSAHETLANDGRRIFFGMLACLIVVSLAADPFFIAGWVAKSTVGVLNDLFSTGDGDTGLLDTFFRPVSQMVNYGYVLEPGQTAPSGKVEASIGTFAAAVLMLITSFVIFVMEILGFALAAYHFLSALFGSMGVLWAVAVSLARRHSFDLVGRAVGFIGAHLLMMVGILFVSLIGPALGTGLAQKIQGDSGNTGKALLSLVLMPVIYALVIYLMVKFSGRTGRVAQALRIGTNKKVRENYGYEGESWLKKVGLSDGTPEVPEPSTSGKLGTLARWGVPGTGYMEKLAKEHGMSLSGADNGEVAAAQDAAESSPLSSSYPDNGQAEQPHREAPEFTTEDGEPVSGYDVPYEVFDERGEPVTGWETDPDTGQPVPTTFAADGEPMPPVDADGHVNEVYDADGAPVYLFPTTAGSSAGMFLEPGDAAPDYVPTEPAVDNVYGDEAPVDDADAFDDGYDTEQPREVPVTTPAAVPGTPDFTATTEIPVVGDAVPDADDPETPAAVVPDAAVQETGEPAGHAVPEQDPDAAATAAAPTEQQWGTPTTYSVPDTTGTGVHGSCVTPVPPARITPALGGFPGEAEIPTRGEPLTAQEEAQAVDRIDRDLSGLPPEAGRQDALPGMEDLGPFHDPYDAYAADQPEVPGEHTFTSSSVRDAVGLDRVLAGIEEARDVQLASGGGSYVPVPVDSAQLELAFTTDELTGTNHVVPAHHVNLDGSLN